MLDIDALLRVQENSYKRAGPGLLSSWPPESAMGADELRAFLEEHDYCVLATTNRDDHPIARPLAFVVLGASFWFATVAGPRLRNLERTPWASVVVEDGGRISHRAVAADGSVALTDLPPDGASAAWEKRHGSVADWAAAWFELRPSLLVSYSSRN
jgi:hypothetical protein